ncbi:unnamed protein product [Peniophora sp. CBMAI 1063]|nr:unnamed protein product [Peniophora sp. CBMAI 1063]
MSMSSEQTNNAKDSAVYTTSHGAPVRLVTVYGAEKRMHLTESPDFHQIDLLAHFDRERIPERVVHAKGAGAHGYFEATHDISDLTCAKLFTQVGTKTRATVRFSTIAGEAGAADTDRDPRGFAIKLRTEVGNLDFVFNNTPIFFIRDPAKFPHFIHTQKRNPQTHLKDADMFWDFLSQNPETVHQVMITFSDRGTPDGYHQIHGYSGHTFKFVNDKGDWQYVQIHIRADNGFKTLDAGKASELQGSNPDYGIESLFKAIESGDHPSWTVYVQTMTPAQAEQFRYNILDLTKVWPHSEFPLRPVGKLVLNENAQNYFAEIEQVAFSPSHLVPGIEPSADPMLQSRLFSYPDAHRHRLGTNYQQLPVNAPIAPVANFQRDGAMAFNNQGARPNYQSSLSPLSYPGKACDAKELKHETLTGVARNDLSVVTELDFEQPRVLYQKVMDQMAREHLVDNLAGHMKNIKEKKIASRQLSVFAAVDQGFADELAAKLGLDSVGPLQVAPAAAMHQVKHGIDTAARGQV